MVIFDKEVSAECTLIDFLRGKLNLSSTVIKSLKYSGSITVNGQSVTVRYPLKASDRLRLEIYEKPADSVLPEDIPLDILFEDKHILVINKPSGMSVHSAPGQPSGTAANAVMSYIGKKDFVFRPVNRLDRYTSGPVIIAKNAVCAGNLARQFKASGTVKKHYIAVLSGTPEKPYGRVDIPITRLPGSVIKRCAAPDGKPSVTEYRVTAADSGGNSLVHLTPLTGRTHQLRVHMAYIGHPLLYDFLYGKEVPGKHFLLHCADISFFHPESGEGIKISSEPPFDISSFKNI